MSDMQDIENKEIDESASFDFHTRFIIHVLCNNPLFFA